MNNELFLLAMAFDLKDSRDDMPLLKSQVCMLIEVFGGDFSRHGNLPGFV